MSATENDGGVPTDAPTSQPSLPIRLSSLLSAAELTASSAHAIFRAADSFFEVSTRSVRKVPALRGKTLLNVFFEASTRTRTSFELAGKRLSMDTVNLAGSSSSTTKGETLLDTIKTLEAMRPDVVVIRHAASGAAAYVAARSSVPIVNAGDGTHEHPTQALLDAYTIRKHKGDIAGLKVAICGDVLHSRVARSNVALLTLLGAQVRLIGPPTLMPAGAEKWGAKVFHDMRAGLKDADVVMMLRLQRERMDGGFFPSAREYFWFYGLDEDKLRIAKPGALVMHPGPMNRGVEIDSSVADNPNVSLIETQVRMGVAVRMAVLEALAESGANQEPA